MPVVVARCCFRPSQELTGSAPTRAGNDERRLTGVPVIPITHVSLAGMRIHNDVPVSIRSALRRDRHGVRRPIA